MLLLVLAIPYIVPYFLIQAATGLKPALWTAAAEVAMAALLFLQIDTSSLGSGMQYSQGLNDALTMAMDAVFIIGTIAGLSVKILLVLLQPQQRWLRGMITATGLAVAPLSIAAIASL